MKKRINFNDKILCFNYSSDQKKVYACLANKKSIIFLNYDSEENTLHLTDEKIEIDEPGDSKKCVHINDNCLLVMDNKTVYLFNKNDLNFQKFTNTNKITFEDKIFGICKIDDKYAIILQKSKLIFINIENLKIEKEIKNIDCAKKSNNLIIIKDCVLVDCEKGIALILIKTQEMVQYIFDGENLGFKKIEKSVDDYIYIFNFSGYLLKYKFYEYNLILYEKSKIEKLEDSNLSTYELFSNYNLLSINKCIFFWSNKIYNI